MLGIYRPSQMELALESPLFVREGYLQNLFYVILLNSTLLSTYESKLCVDLLGAGNPREVKGTWHFAMGGGDHGM